VVRERSGIIWTLRPIGSRGSYRDGEMISDESDDIRKPQKRSENYDDSDNPTAPITLTDDIRRQSAPSPQGRRPGEILQGRGAKALEECVPEVAPASSRKGWSRPWSGRGGNGTVRIPTTLGP